MEEDRAAQRRRIFDTGTNCVWLIGRRGRRWL